jgi:hypothetical protein
MSFQSAVARLALTQAAKFTARLGVPGAVHRRDRSYAYFCWVGRVLLRRSVLFACRISKKLKGVEY